MVHSNNSPISSIRKKPYQDKAKLSTRLECDIRIGFPVVHRERTEGRTNKRTYNHVATIIPKLEGIYYKI